MSDLAKKYISRLEQLQGDRHNFENMWQLLSDYFEPHSENITSSGTQANNSKRIKVFDSTGALAAAYLTAEIHSGMTNPAIDWLALKATSNMKDDENLAELFYQFEQSLLNTFNSSNSSFQLQNHQFISSCVVYGTGCMYVDDALDKGVKFTCIPINEIFIAEDQYGAIDVVMRKYTQSLRQLVQAHGEDKLPNTLKQQYQKNPNTKVQVLHVAIPKEDEPDISVPSGQTYVCLTILPEHGQLIKTSFYYENPYTVARFSKISGEAYGRSPAWQCMPTNKGLQTMTSSVLKASQFATQPVLLTSDDGVMMPLKATPGAIMPGALDSNGQARVQPLNMGSRLDIGIAILDRSSKAIRDAFFVDQLVFRDTGTMTATEVVQRQQEALKLILPYIGRLQTEYLLPVIHRSLSIKIRNNEFGDAKDLPKEFINSGYDVVFCGTLATLQRSVSLGKFNQFAQYLATFAQVSPESLVNVDFDTALRHIAAETGVWADSIHTQEEVLQIKQQMQEAQQAQQAMGAMSQLAEINKNAQ